MKLLVTGATGQLGRLAVELMIAKKESGEDIDIIAFARNEDKAKMFHGKDVELRFGDYDDNDSLEKAFEGVDLVLFISASDIPVRNKQHINVIDALKKANVGRVVYISFQPNAKQGESVIEFARETHKLTEKWLKEGELSYTILHNTSYAEMLPFFLGDDVIKDGKMILPAGEGKVPFATRQDMAEAAVNALLSDDHENKVYIITNSRLYSFQEISEYISKAAGRRIEYLSPSQDEFKKIMKSKGRPDGIIDFASGFAEAYSRGEFDFVSNDLEFLLGRKPTTLEEYLHSVYGNHIKK